MNIRNISKSGRFRKMSKKAEMAVCDFNMFFFADHNFSNGVAHFNHLEEHKFLVSNLGEIKICEEHHNVIINCIDCFFRKLIDWAKDGHRYVDDEEDEEDEEPEDNIYPYKKCSVCSERKSCGNYDINKIWFCEDCYEEEDE